MSLRDIRRTFIHGADYELAYTEHRLNRKLGKTIEIALPNVAGVTPDPESRTIEWEDSGVNWKATWRQVSAAQLAIQIYAMRDHIVSLSIYEEDIERLLPPAIRLATSTVKALDGVAVSLSIWRKNRMYQSY